MILKLNYSAWYWHRTADGKNADNDSNLYIHKCREMLRDILKEGTDFLTCSFITFLVQFQGRIRCYVANMFGFSTHAFVVLENSFVPNSISRKAEGRKKSYKDMNTDFCIYIFLPLSHYPSPSYNAYSFVSLYPPSIFLLDFFKCTYCFHLIMLIPLEQNERKLISKSFFPLFSVLRRKNTWSNLYVYFFQNNLSRRAIGVCKALGTTRAF